MAKKRIFVSFDYDKDKKEMLSGQAKLQKSSFTFSDWSLKEAQKEKEWKDKELSVQVTFPVQNLESGLKLLKELDISP